MSRLLEQYKIAGDPYHLGHTSQAQIGLGYVATGGTVFPFAAGAVLLMRRALYPSVAPWSYCGWARPAATTISNYQGFTHQQNMGYQYAACHALGNGFVSLLSEPVRVDFDGAGALITPALPVFPRNISATPIDGGKFLIDWTYDPYGQGAFPTDFQVFEGATPSLNYGSPLVDSVTSLDHTQAVGTSRAYGFTTAAFADASVHYFGVRARSSTAVAEQNTTTAGPMTANSTGPAAALPLDVIVRGNSREY